VSEPEPRLFRVTVPSWRATKDVSVKDDLVEEVGRMVGYASIQPTAPLVAASVPPANPTREFQHEVRGLYVDLGFTEVYNYSFLSEESVQAFGLDPAAHLRVANPIASDQALMRTSLLPGIWRNVLENAKYGDSFRLFEIGLEIHKAAAGLPDEIPHLAAAIYERHGDGRAGIFEIKHSAECLLPGAQAVPATARAFEHPARSADLHWRGEVVGRFFELHPRLVEAGRAAMLDLDLRAVQSLSGTDVKFTPIRRYPSSAFDLSVVAPARAYAGSLQTEAASFAGPLLEEIQFVREYAGLPLPEGSKSVSFRVTVGSPERTLSSEEVGEIRAAMIAGMRGLGYELRV
jgi:phenylalanyl-tRNA synthetase beta chain